VAKSGGSVVARDKFNDMIDLSADEEARPAGLLIWNLARFSRDLDDSSYYKALLRKRGIEVHSLTDPIPDGEFGRAVEVLIDIANQERRRQISRDVKRALSALVRMGFSSGGFPPRGYLAERVVIGYRRDGSKREVSRWVPDPELWELVRLAWELRAQGATYKKIQDATGRKIYKSDSCWVTHFSNKSYLGVGKCGSLEVEDHHPAAVDRETWDQVQAVQMASPRFGVADHPYHPRRVGLPSLLSGLAVCIHCGSSMGVHNQRGWRCYVCRRKENQDYHGCPGRLVNARKADEAILGAFFGRVLTVDYLDELVRALQGIVSSQADLDQDIVGVEMRQADNERRIRNLMDTAEYYGPEAVRDRLPGKLAERSRLAEELRALEAKKRAAQGLELSPEAFQLVLDRWRKQALDAQEKKDIIKLKEVLRVFIARLEVGYNVAKVHWTFPISELVWNYSPIEMERVGGTLYISDRH
jgi:DNA invertase Pin-like site-specific DNA recombinase